MKLREWDFDAANQGAYVEREYPDAPVQEFVNWFRNTRQWRESPEMVYHRWLKFERELTEIRNGGLVPVVPTVATLAAPITGTVTTLQRCSAQTKAGAPCKGKAVQDGLCVAHVKHSQVAA